MAILKRGKKRDFWRRVQEAAWPSQGWRRTLHYYRHRIFRTGDSTYKITAGLASGAAVSWSPFLGTHFAQALFLSWIVRGNLLAGFVGTALGNPTTFPLMFWLSYKLGVMVLIVFGVETVLAPGVEDLDFKSFLADPPGFMAHLFANPLLLLLPMVIGGYLCALFCWPLAYAILYFPVRTARKAYRLQRLKRSRKSRK